MDIALEKFKDDERILGINGFNLGFKRFKYELNLTKLAIIWGCGLYKRLWDYYDHQLRDWFLEKNKLKSKIYNKKIFYYVETYFDQISKGNLFTWDTQILHALWRNDKFFLTSKFNYIQNIGFEKGTSNFLISYHPNYDKKLPKKLEINYSRKLDEKFYDFLLIGGWIRLFFIRVYMNSPKIIKNLFHFFVKILNKLKNYEGKRLSFKNY